MSDLEEKLARIAAGNFVVQRNGKQEDSHDTNDRSRRTIPNSVSVRLQSNSDDDDEEVQHPTYDDVYKSLSEPNIPPSPSRMNRQNQPKQAFDPFQQTVNLQLEQPSAVQVIHSPQPEPSPVGDNYDDGQDISFLGVVDNSGDIPYDLSVSDAQDNTFTMDDLAAANDIARNLSAALDTKAAGNDNLSPNNHHYQQPPSPARQNSSQVPSSPLSRPSSKQSNTPSRIPTSARPPIAAASNRSQSNPRGANGTPQKPNSSIAPSTPIRTNGNNSNAPNSANNSKYGTPVAGTPTRPTDRSRATSPDGTMGSNTTDRVIRLAARVRPMSSTEYSQRARRTISKVGNDVVVVNPKSFEAEPDTIAAAAIAVNNSQWAHAFSLDRCLWSYDISNHTECFFDQPTVHEMIGLDLVENILIGVNVSCFAYGHPGSGKTYTMFGGSEQSHALTRSSSSNSVNKRTTSPAPHQRQHSQSARKVQISPSQLQLTAQSGLVPRVFHDIVRTVKEHHVSIRESRIFFSYYMVYNDMVVDLLVEPSTEPPREDQQDTLDSLRVREHPVYGPYVENLKRMEIFSVEDVFRYIAEGDAHRGFIQSAWHLSGSRYHAIASLDLASVDLNEVLRVDPNRRVLLDHSHGNVQQAIAQSLTMSAGTHLSSSTNNAGSNNNLPFRIEGEQLRRDSSGRIIKIQMVDLAGSDSEHSESNRAAAEESNVWSGTNFHDTTPNRRLKNVMDRDKKEMRSIRQSLTTLGFLIQSLAKGAATKSLPYRDSTLTFLLRDSLNGYQHTTLIGTVSPAHTQFEETLGTLRYLEKFNLLMMNRRRASSGPHSSASVPLGLSISKAALKEPRALLIENFRKFHSDLDLNHKGSSMQRQLLKETVADPQQRIAKLTRNATEPSISVYSQSPGAPSNGYPYGATTPAKSSNAHPNHVGMNMTFTSPIDGSLRRLRDITSEDLEHLQSSYRDLQSRVLELQIDFDAVRTDRDTLMVELRATRERLRDLEDDRDNAQNKTQNVNKALKNYEKEVMELRSQLRRREEENDRLMTDLTEQKQARQGSEQAYHARTKEFLQRFDSVTKEKKALQAALELASHKDAIYNNEKQDMMGQISKLRSELEHHIRTIEDQTIEIRVLGQDLQQSRQIADLKEIIEQEKFDIEHDRNDLLMKLDGLVQDHQVLLTERDSLLAMIKQKDSLLWLQSQQSEASIKMLQQRQAALERVGQETSQSSGDFQKLLDSLRELFQREGQVFTSSDGQAALDTSTLITLIRELKEKIVLFDRIEQEFHALESRYQTEVNLRQQSEEKFYDLSHSLQSAEMSNAELSKQLVEVHRELEAMKRLRGQDQNNNNTPRSPVHNYHYRISTSTTNQQDIHQELHLVITQLQEKLDVQTSENQRLQVQLQASQKETQVAKEEVNATQNTMQREFASLWMSVQELNKLDALKDKSIQELIQERTQLTLERDTSVERLRATTIECESLRKELEEVDRELQRAVGMDHRALNRQGFPMNANNQNNNNNNGNNNSINNPPLLLTSSPQHSVIFLQPQQQQQQGQTPQQLASSNNTPSNSYPNNNNSNNTATATMVPVMMVPQQALLSQMMLPQQPQQQQQQQQQPPPLPMMMPAANTMDYVDANNNFYLSSNASIASVPMQQQQQQQSQQQSRRYPANTPLSSAGGSRMSNGRGRYRDIDEDEDGLHEEILMHQIEELTGFLHDEERLKRVRIAKNTPSPPATNAASFYQQQQYQQSSQAQLGSSQQPMMGGLFTPQQSHQKPLSNTLRGGSQRNNNSNLTPSQQRRFN